MRTTQFLALSAVLTLGARPVRAQGQEPYAPPEFIHTVPILPASMAGGHARNLTLEETIELAVKNNLDIALVRHKLAKSRHARRVSRGDFEPAITGSYSHDDSIAPPRTTLEGEPEDIQQTVIDRGRLGLEQTLRSGTVLRVDFDNARTDSETGAVLEPLSYRSSLSATITQPLLRGFSLDRDIPSAEILRADLDSERVRHDVAIAVLATVEAAEDAYWDLVGVLKDYQVRLESLRLAERQMELTRRQIAAGIRAPADLINAEGTLAQREFDLLRAESAIAGAGDRLRTAINLPAETWSIALLPTEVPRFAPRAVNPDQALARAQKNRPELQQQRIDLDRARLEVRVAENQRLPDLSLSASYGLLGQDSTYGKTLDQLTSSDARFWSVSVNLRWEPLGRTARAQTEIQRVNLRSAKTQLEKRLQSIHVEVRQAVRDVQSAARQVRAAAKFRALAERSLDAEQRKFLNGTSDNFLVGQRQAELARAQQAELTAVIAHLKAQTDLDRATGELLEKRGIRLTVAGKGGGQ